MSEPITIREATVDDAREVSDLVMSLARFFLTDPDDRSAAEPFIQTNTPGSIGDSIASGRLRYHLAIHDGAVVGVVGVRDNTHLYHLFVAESMHRRGIAGRLWATARATAVSAGNQGRFTVNSSLAAVPLYERLGFRATGARQDKHGIAYLPMALGAGPPAS